jgi:uncharacterized tellurite resistance protein B-like protein
MRSYRPNSPEAAGRILALVLVADGHVCRTEFEQLERLGAAAALGLPEGALPRLVHELCEDLLAAAYGSGSMMASVDDATLAALLAEVDEPSLRAEVLRLAQAAAVADRHLAEGETIVLDAARRHWGLAETAMPTPAAPARAAAAPAAA